MYVTSDKKVFLHMPKTAGISFHRSLQEAKDIFIQCNMRHQHISMLPQKYSEYPRYIILRNPLDWYISFYKFFSETEGFFSFLLKDRDEEMNETLVNFDTFIFRAMNLKRFFLENPQKADIINSIIQEQEQLHFMMTFFTEVISMENINNFDCSLFDFFWKGTGGDTAQVIPMDENLSANVEKIFGFPMNSHENKTDSKIQLSLKDLSDETKAIIIYNHKRFFYSLGLMEDIESANIIIEALIEKQKEIDEAAEKLKEIEGGTAEKEVEIIT